MPNRMPAARRRWQATLIVSIFTLAVAAAAAIGWWYARESPPHQGPLVLISVNTLEARQLATYGGSARQPAIDALAADAVVFERAYTHSTQTLPAHASLLSGRLPFEHGVRNDGGFTLGTDQRTLAELLRSRGFATGGAVSSFLLRRASGVAQGFSFYNADLPEPAPEQAPPVARDGVQTLEAAEPWLQMQTGQRYFLFLEVDRQSADTVVGRLVHELKQRDLYDRATIVLTGDHGSDEPSTALADSSIWVPLLIKQPESEGSGRRVDAPVQHIDLLPTLLDVVRAPMPGGLRGRSLRPILDSESGVIASAPIYAESLEAAYRLGGVPVYTVTDGSFRLVRGLSEEISRLAAHSAAAPPAATDPEAAAERLRSALDRILDGRQLPPASDVAAADEAAYAAAGYLGGLKAIDPRPAPIDASEEAALVENHRAAVRLVASNHVAAAVTELRALTRTHPTLANVHFQIGRLLARLGRFAEAADAFGIVDMLRPDDPDVPMARAATLLRAHQLEDAQVQSLRAVSLAAHSEPSVQAAAHEIATRVALAMGDHDAATMHAAEAQRAVDTLPLPQFVRGRIAYDEARYDEAVEAFAGAEATLRQHDSSLAELHLCFGDALARLDRYAEAETQYREELRAFPQNIRAYTSLAMLYRASNREQAIEETIDELVTAAPTPEGYTMAARLWMIVGERSRADALRADARRKFKGDPSLANLN